MADVALTTLGVMVLALLREGDMHPYEMMRLLRHRREDRMVRLTNGTFYHTVARLQRDGLIAEVGVDRDGNRPERTTYTLTDDGPAALEEWVRGHLGRTDGLQNFRVALGEAHNLSRAEAVVLLTSRRDGLAAEYAAMSAGLQDARGRGVLEQYLVELDRYTVILRADLDWTDALLARIAGDDFPWGGDDLAPVNPVAVMAAREAVQQ